MHNFEFYHPDDGSIRGETCPKENNVKQESIYIYICVCVCVCVCVLPNKFIFWNLVHREVKHER